MDCGIKDPQLLVRCSWKCNTKKNVNSLEGRFHFLSLSSTKCVRQKWSINWSFRNELDRDSVVGYPFSISFRLPRPLPVYWHFCLHCIFSYMTLIHILKVSADILPIQTHVINSWLFFFFRKLFQEFRFSWILRYLLPFLYLLYHTKWIICLHAWCICFVSKNAWQLLAIWAKQMLVHSSKIEPLHLVFEHSLSIEERGLNRVSLLNKLFSEN